MGENLLAKFCNPGWFNLWLSKTFFFHNHDIKSIDSKISCWKINISKAYHWPCLCSCFPNKNWKSHRISWNNLFMIILSPVFELWEICEFEGRIASSSSKIYESNIFGLMLKLKQILRKTHLCISNIYKNICFEKSL